MDKDTPLSTDLEGELASVAERAREASRAEQANEAVRADERVPLYFHPDFNK